MIPKFQEQIDTGGPVTVTHPEMVRYFMSIPEAAQLVLQAGSMGLGGEIFVMDMGEPVQIVDLARDMIRLSELSESEIRIVYTGLRPGEKLFEELLADDEHTAPHAAPEAAHSEGARGGPRFARRLARVAARGGENPDGLGSAPRPQALGSRVPVAGAPEANGRAASACCGRLSGTPGWEVPARRAQGEWRARHDSNVRPLPSEGSALIQLSYGRVSIGF